MGCTHTSRLDASARVSFNAVLSKKYIYSAKSMIASVSADHYTQPLSMGNRQVLMLFTAPSVWETLQPARLPACLPACSTALGVWAPLGAKLVNRCILLWTATACSTACCWFVHSIGLPCFPNTARLPACLLLAKLLLVCGHP